MGNVVSKVVKVTKYSIMCHSCYNQELSAVQESFSNGYTFKYMCPNCHTYSFESRQYPIFEYKETNPNEIEEQMVSVFSKLIAFSDLPKYVNASDPILSEAVKKRLQNGF